MMKSIPKNGVVVYASPQTLPYILLDMHRRYTFMEDSDLAAVYKLAHTNITRPLSKIQSVELDYRYQPHVLKSLQGVLRGFGDGRMNNVLYPTWALRNVLLTRWDTHFNQIKFGWHSLLDILSESNYPYHCVQADGGPKGAPNSRFKHAREIGSKSVYRRHDWGCNGGQCCADKKYIRKYENKQARMKLQADCIRLTKQHGQGKK
jgi:hypothetical protein